MEEKTAMMAAEPAMEYGVNSIAIRRLDQLEASWQGSDSQYAQRNKAFRR